MASPWCEDVPDPPFLFGGGSGNETRYYPTTCTIISLPRGKKNTDHEIIIIPRLDVIYCM